MAAVLGCMADDFTGGTDPADTLARPGTRTVQTCDLPFAEQTLPDTDAVITPCFVMCSGSLPSAPYRTPGSLQPGD